MPRYIEGSEVRLTENDKIFVDAEFYTGEKFTDFSCAARHSDKRRSAPILYRKNGGNIQWLIMMLSKQKFREKTPG